MQIDNVEIEGRRELIAAFFLVILLIIIALAVFYGVVSPYLGKFGYVMTDQRGDWGTLGDYVGGLTNPTLSFLALLVLLVSFFLQLRESKRNALALRQQLLMSQHQKFESTFFKLTDRLDSFSTKYLRVRTDDGSFLAKSLYLQLKANSKALNAADESQGLILSNQHAVSIVRPLFENYVNFCRLAAQCLYFVDQSHLSHREKKFYASVFRDTFESYELSLFLTLSVKSSPQSVELVRKYKLAEVLKPTSFCSRYIANVYFGYLPATS